MTGFTKIEFVVVISLLAATFLSAVLALNPQQFIAKSEDNKKIEALKKIGNDVNGYLAQNPSSDVCNPQTSFCATGNAATVIIFTKLQADANNALCFQSKAWGVYSSVDKRIGIVCSSDSPKEGHQNFIK